MTSLAATRDHRKSSGCRAQRRTHSRQAAQPARCFSASLGAAQRRTPLIGLLSGARAQRCTLARQRAPSRSAGMPGNSVEPTRPWQDKIHDPPNKESTHESWRTRFETPEGVDQADGRLNRTRVTPDASAVSTQKLPPTPKALTARDATRDHQPPSYSQRASQVSCTITRVSSGSAGLMRCHSQCARISLVGFSRPGTSFR